MTIKVTPLFSISLALLVYGLLLLFVIDPGEEGWGKLAGAVITALAIGLMMIYVLMRLVFKSKIKKQIIVELVLILILVMGYHLM